MPLYTSVFYGTTATVLSYKHGRTKQILPIISLVIYCIFSINEREARVKTMTSETSKYFTFQYGGF